MRPECFYEAFNLYKLCMQYACTWKNPTLNRWLFPQDMCVCACVCVCVWERERERERERENREKTSSQDMCVMCLTHVCHVSDTCVSCVWHMCVMCLVPIFWYKFQFSYFNRVMCKIPLWYTNDPTKIGFYILPRKFVQDTLPLLLKPPPLSPRVEWRGLKIGGGNLLFLKGVFCIFRCQSIWVRISEIIWVAEFFGEITKWPKLVIMRKTHALLRLANTVSPLHSTRAVQDTSPLMYQKPHLSYTNHPNPIQFLHKQNCRRRLSCEIDPIQIGKLRCVVKTLCKTPTPLLWKWSQLTVGVCHVQITNNQMTTWLR